MTQKVYPQKSKLRTVLMIRMSESKRSPTNKLNQQIRVESQAAREKLHRPIDSNGWFCFIKTCVRARLFACASRCLDVVTFGYRA